MQIVFLGDDYQWDELLKSAMVDECCRVQMLTDFFSTEGDIYLYGKYDFTTIDFTKTTKPVLINSVVKTLAELNTPSNVLRINGWQTFLQRPVWEIAGNVTTDIATILSSSLQKKIITVSDEVGFASAKVVSMIINEAYFALQDEVSSKDEIDIAMKLGTNYPYGPFEWALKIGAKNIYNLLHKLSEQEVRYTPSTLLKNETA